ncbi:hypothetical protein [Chryseolinea lacunae]|uniref:Uncharacterized protein n=1 Tax=Chryseolinea lacunae TaxID=2801331 RepID=A0ABS1KR40_9BACT|nr:hypothetical protein [Chryseolinea lacunae]MBL0741909.1 hypothetical protein [Chryseolinea lacunae]
MTFEFFLITIQINFYLSGLIALLAWIFVKRRSWEVKFLGLINFNGFLVGVVTTILPLKGKEINIPNTCWVILDFFVVAALFYHGFGRRFGKFLFPTAGILTMLAIVNILFVQQMNINSYSIIMHSFFVLCCSVFYFYRLLTDMPKYQIQRLPMFYFSAGLLINSAGVFFLYLFTNYIIKFFYDDMLIYWTLHNCLLIFQLLIFIFGLGVDLNNIRNERREQASRGKLD